MNALNYVPVWMHLYFYFGIAMILVQSFVGTRQWRKLHYGVVRQRSDRRLNVLAVVGGVLFAITYMVEESAGIEAWHEMGAMANNADAAMTVGFGLLVAFVAAFAVAAGVLYFVGHVASWAAKGYLHIQMEENPQRDAVKEAQRRQRRREAQARRGVEPPRQRPARQQIPRRHREVTAVNLRPR